MNYKIPVILIQNTVIYHWILGWPTHLPSCFGFGSSHCFPRFNAWTIQFYGQWIGFLGQENIDFSHKI